MYQAKRGGGGVVVYKTRGEAAICKTSAPKLMSANRNIKSCRPSTAD